MNSTRKEEGNHTEIEDEQGGIAGGNAFQIPFWGVHGPQVCRELLGSWAMSSGFRAGLSLENLVVIENQESTQEMSQAAIGGHDAKARGGTVVMGQQKLTKLRRDVWLCMVHHSSTATHHTGKKIDIHKTVNGTKCHIILPNPLSRHNWCYLPLASDTGFWLWEEGLGVINLAWNSSSARSKNAIVVLPVVVEQRQQWELTKMSGEWQEMFGFDCGTTRTLFCCLLFRCFGQQETFGVFF